MQQAAFPVNYPAFQAYYQGMITDRLAVTDSAREIAHNIIWNAGYYRAISPLILLLASGMLPERVRNGFDLPWNPAMEKALDLFSAQTRVLRALVPNRLLFRPAYMGGLRRTRQTLFRERFDFLMA